MSETMILCGGGPVPRRPPARVLELDVAFNARPENRVRIDLGGLTDRLADDLPDVLIHALHLAAYVYSGRPPHRPREPRGAQNGRRLAAADALPGRCASRYLE